MHELSVFWLRAATALYAIGLLHTIQTVLRRHSDMPPSVLRVFFLASVFHFVSLVETSFIARRFPANNFHETVSLCAFLFALLFFFLHVRYRFDGVSVFLFPLVSVMSLIASMQVPVASWPTTATRDAFLVVHVLLALLGYAALLLTAVASVFYLIQEKQLKSKKPGRFFDHLPALGTLDNIMSRSMTFGFVLVTLGLVSGITWAYVESGTTWVSDPRIVVTFLTWAISLLMVFLRITAGWRGRKAAILAVTVLGCSAATWAAHSGLRSLFIQ